MPRELASLGVPSSETSNYWGNLGERPSRSRGSTTTPQRRTSREVEEDPNDEDDLDYVEEDIKYDVVENERLQLQQQQVAQQLQTQKQEQQHTQRPANDTKWTDAEKKVFVDGLSKHGKDWKALAELVVTKTQMQCRTHYNNFKKKHNFERVVRKFEQQQQQLNNNNNNNNNSNNNGSTNNTVNNNNNNNNNININNNNNNTTTATATTVVAPAQGEVTPAKGKKKSKVISN